MHHVPNPPEAPDSDALAVTVRVAGPADVSGIRRLAIEVQRFHHERRPDLFTPEGTDTSDEIVERVGSPCDEYWVALGGGAVVGYAYAHWGDRPESRWRHAERVLELKQMGVTSAWRGRGVGRALWRHVQRRAESEKVDRIELTVWPFNAEAVAFYERLGFAPFRTRMALDPDVDGAPPGAV